jgi:hypothetical protein
VLVLENNIKLDVWKMSTFRAIAGEGALRHPDYIARMERASMADTKLNPNAEYIEAFRKLINEYKDAIRVSVLEELIESCYGPQAVLDGKKIRDVIDFKFWLEKKLQDAREQQAAKEGTQKTTAPHVTEEMLKEEWATKRGAAKAAAA